MYTWIGIAIVLFLVVIWNSWRITKGRRNRRHKNFRKNYFDKKKQHEGS
jgi:hypothetical protein